MSPGEIRACYRLYAAHRKSREICAFPGSIPAASNAGNSDDLAVLLRRHTTGLEELAVLRWGAEVIGVVGSSK
jgi:hypothetical protein